ncbi:MAG: stage V sporulation protein T, partial [Clostridia bacterium]|nr:stage V sporulation protein T [Clostridia bacterium]
IGDAADELYALEGVAVPVSIIAPIISAGDIAGAVVFLNVCDAKEIPQSDIKLATVAASFLGKNMED